MPSHNLNAQSSLLILFASLTSATNTSSINQTDCWYTFKPEAEFGWFWSPNLRGTFDIIWSCLSALFICLWTALHLNVPSQTDTWFTIWIRKFKWMAIGIVTPEILTFMALAQRIAAIEGAKQMEQSSGRRWTITHGFFVNMGGFIVDSTENKAHTLTAEELCTLVQNGKLHHPDISVREIEDKSKADGLVKGIACIQASWLGINCIVREARGLPICTLELATLAYVSCALVCYCAWWDKPLEVLMPIHIQTSAPIDIASCRVRAKNTDCEYAHGYRAGGWAILTGVVFGIIHCLAWNFTFPTPIERLIWRISASVITVFGPISIPFIGGILHARRVTNIPIIRNLAVFCGVLLYTSCRLFLIVEPFTCLRKLEGTLFQTVEWTSFIPHI